MGQTEPEYRLVYFNVRALGEPIRWIFAYTGTKFVDERIPWDYRAWFGKEKDKYSSTLGQVPVLHTEGKELSQSQVISRCLATKFGLVGDTLWENAKIDEVISMVHDTFILWRNTSFEKDETRKTFMKAGYLDPMVKMCYEKWSKILEESPRGPFILGEKVTHADFWLANIISIWDDPPKGIRPVLIKMFAEPSEDDLFIGMTKDYPLLKQHKDAVENIPEIKEWISRRPETMS